jgi:glycosyltransferase involved in cell wall biosynthesis
MPDTPDYSIVIPAYNEAEVISGTLEQAQQAMACTHLLGELIVVDNNSDDATPALALAGGARVVAEPVNQISRARNAGAQAAKGRYLVFVDADTQLSDRLLSAALQNLTQRDCVGGGALIAADRTASAGTQRIIDGWNHLSRFTRTAAGCFIYCQRDAFVAVGGFSEKVYASEEIGLSRALKRYARGRYADFTIIADPKVRTSLRKLEWFTPGELIMYTLVLFLPFALRSKRLCAFWYRRPATRDNPSANH